MICASRLIRRLRLPAIAALVVATSLAAPGDRTPFATSTTLANEASMLTKLLDELHYNHDAVRVTDYASVIPDYMGELDGQRLFFLGTDRSKFVADYGKSVYYNTAFLGNINAAYEIFYVYQTRVEHRIAWIMEQLKKEFDLTTNES